MCYNKYLPVVCFRSAHLLVAANAVFLFNASAAVFTLPTVSGQAPSGVLWSDVAAGTSLPVRSSGPQNGAPGAVAYWDTDTGQLQIDPRGWNIALFNFTYTTGITNVNASTPGPLNYSSGNNPTSKVISGATGFENQRTLPAGTWALITALPARVAGTVSLVRSPTLATSYESGNGAADGLSYYSTNPYGSSVTPGWFSQPWAFPSDMISPTSAETMSVDNWKVFGVSGNANANVLGYGNYRGVFQYTIDGVTGNQVGAVIPYSSVIPEPTSSTLFVTGVIAYCFVSRRRNARC